jgi:HSP20 family protein
MATRIVRYNPWNELNVLSRAMDNWLGDAWKTATVQYTGPAVDIAETDEAYTLKAALPGWKPSDVDVTFEDGAVTIKGEVKPENEGESTGDDKIKWHRREIRKAAFQRTVNFPVDVEADKANAEFENGVLMLTLPKAEVVKPKQIKIVVK